MGEMIDTYYKTPRGKVWQEVDNLEKERVARSQMSEETLAPEKKQPEEFPKAA